MDNANLEWRKEWRKMAIDLCEEIRHNATSIIISLEILSTIDTNSRQVGFDLHADNPNRSVPITPEMSRGFLIQVYEKARTDILYAAEQLRAIPSETEDDEAEGGEDLP